MWRSVTAVVVLAAVSGCTVQAAGTSAEPDPIRISTAPVETDDPKPESPEKPAQPADPAGDDASPSQAAKPPKPSPTPPPKVLWSRGDQGRDVREVQARLRQIAWLFEGPTGTYGAATVAAVKGFQGKRGLPQTGKTDSVTWQRLLNMTYEPGKWELYAAGDQPAAKPDPRCMTGRVMCISKTSRTLRWMIDGRTLSTVDVRFGSQYTPTREGEFNVTFKSRHHVSTLYDTPMPYAMFFSGGQAVHYSSDFAATGYNGASHGCVNVRDEATLAALFAQVRSGDKVVVHW
ncbi:L,D-transpeptidase family protein [Streptomyces vastus]|uniref:L,D-transpeptidase family protein n=1 Tax=Streptomyces vastus TaxID=285451 RepID=UPI0031D47AD5